MIFCFQDRVLKFCLKAYWTTLNPRLIGIFDIPTFSIFGIVYSGALISKVVLFQNWVKSRFALILGEKNSSKLKFWTPKLIGIQSTALKFFCHFRGSGFCYFAKYHPSKVQKFIKIQIQSH